KPIMFTGLTVKIVGFESASGKRLESASLVVQGPTRFGKRHTTDARWSADSVTLTLDVHDAAVHGCGPLTVYVFSGSAGSRVDFLQAAIRLWLKQPLPHKPRSLTRAKHDFRL